MKKIIITLFVLLILCGCAPKIIDGDITIDLTQEFDVNTILDNVKEDTQVSYELDRENSKIIVTLINDDKAETLEKEVTILEPQYTIKDDIKFNPYLDYNINDFITVDEGVKVDHTVDTKASKLIFNLSKGHWSKTVEADVTLESILDFSNVSEYGALIYVMTDWENKNKVFYDYFFNNVPGVGSIDVIVFAEDHTGFHVRYISRGHVPVQTTFVWDENGLITLDNLVDNAMYSSNLTIEYYINYFGGDEGLHEKLIVEDNDTIKVLGDEKLGECLYFKRVDSYTQPYNVVEYLNSFGRTVETAWISGAKYASVWYEPDFKNYSNDYNGIKKYSDVMYDGKHELR